MKKILAIFLLIVLMFSLSACSKNDKKFVDEWQTWQVVTSDGGNGEPEYGVMSFKLESNGEFSWYCDGVENPMAKGVWIYHKDTNEIELSHRSGHNSFYKVIEEDGRITLLEEDLLSEKIFYRKSEFKIPEKTK